MPSRILVVDDNEIYLGGIKELLEDAGYDTFVATTFDDAKAELRDHAPDLLILDVRLGAFNGLQLISTGRVRIPAIVVTGFDDPVLRADASGFGASYMVKPVPPAELLELIGQKLTAAHAGDGAPSVDPQGFLVPDIPDPVAPSTEHGSRAAGAPRRDIE